MTNRSEELLQLANDFVQFHKDHVVHAYAYGSVARKEADQYSDLDMTIYTSHSVLEDQHTVEVSGEVIQVSWHSLQEFPNEVQVKSDPWGYRFLSEVVLLKDDGAKLERARDFALRYFETIEAQEKMIRTVAQMVEQKLSFARDMIHNDQPYTATNAAMHAWSEAAFLALYLERKSVSTGDLIPYVVRNEDDEKRFTEMSFLNKNFTKRPEQIIQSFRNHLSENQPFEDPTSNIQNQLCEKKANRLMKNDDLLNLSWQMYGEAIWLYLETSTGKSVEEYLNELPTNLQQQLAEIGFTKLTFARLGSISRWTHELLEKSERQLNQ